MDFADVPGFMPLSAESFRTLRERACGFYHVHAPLDMHPEVSPSRLCAEGVGLERLEEYFPMAEGIPGGAAIVGESNLTVEGLAEAFRAYLGPEIEVHVLTRPRQEAGRVAVVAGGGVVETARGATDWRSRPAVLGAARRSPCGPSSPRSGSNRHGRRPHGTPP